MIVLNAFQNEVLLLNRVNPVGVNWLVGLEMTSSNRFSNLIF